MSQAIGISNSKGTIAQATELDAEERWLAYLKSLSERKLANEGVSTVAQQLWYRLRQLDGAIRPPNARPTDDGGMRMSWTENGRYLEIEIAADAATFEWFYRDTSAKISDGDDAIPVTETPNQLLSRLRDLIVVNG